MAELPCVKSLDCKSNELCPFPRICRNVSWSPGNAMSGPKFSNTKKWAENLYLVAWNNWKILAEGVNPTHKWRVRIAWSLALKSLPLPIWYSKTLTIRTDFLLLAEKMPRLYDISKYISGAVMKILRV